MIAAEGFLWGLIFIMGASIFSFLNVVIYRLPRHISFVQGRSRCPSCDAQLTWYDMVPVFNWFYLKGRCRSCKASVSFRYPAVEILGGVAGVLSFWQYGFSLKGLLVFVFLCILTVVGFIDYDTMEIPNTLVLAALAVGMADMIVSGEPLWWERLIGMFAVGLPMLFLTLAVPGAFGGGDIKLVAASGLFLGWKMILLGGFLAIVTGGVYGALLLIRKKAGRKDHFAFGPFLCVGMAAALFWGQKLLEWYLHLFGL